MDIHSGAWILILAISFSVIHIQVSDHNAKLGSEGSVVKKIVNKLPSGLSFKVTFSNLFTSLALLNTLSENGISTQGH